MDNNLEHTAEEKKEMPPEPTLASTPTPVSEPAKEATSEASTFDFSQHSLIAAASYLGPLVVIPFLTNKEDPFTKFHIKQGLVLLVIYLILWVFQGFMYFLMPLFQLINFGLLILSIIGIVYTLQRKEKELPLVGQFAAHIKI